ncbi:MAG: FHA domain-containing protein [Candidatus Spyradocola sp.]|jgi:predicted component of type VI protein secretion system
MNASAYELLANIARYWFLGLALVIAVRMILAVVREMRIEWRVQREISEAGTSINATLILLSDEDRRLRRGKLYAVEGETTVGRSRNCDVRIGSPSLKGTHCILNMEGDGMNVVPVGDAFVVVDGEIVGRRALARDGSTIQMGGLVFRLRLEEENAI